MAVRYKHKSRFVLCAQYQYTVFLQFDFDSIIYLRCLSVSEQGKQKSSDLRERAIKWDGKQKVTDHICCELINYTDEVMYGLFLSW
jgi:hypothetical protein